MIHNVDVAEHAAPDAIRAALAQQAASPVHWTATVRRMVELGVTHVVECGPGRVLAGMNKRIAEGIESYALIDSDAINETLAALKGA